jgi:adenylate cyclase class IV
MAEELKIYIDDPDEIEDMLREIGADYLDELQITDTYFDQPGMVLKLTEDQHGSYLTQLQAQDGGFKFIKKEDIPDPASKKKELENEFGIKCVLKKRKRLWKLEDYDINLNLFEDIGNFLIVEGERVTPDFFTERMGIKDPKYLIKSFAQLKLEQ